MGNGAVLRGFTITGSGLFPGVCLVDASPIIEENTIEGNFAGGTGGGIYGYQSSPIIRHNRIRNNGCYSITPHRSAQGAGIYLKGETITPRIHGNFILDNDAHCGMGMCLGIYGGGIYVEGGSPRIVGNVIAGNRVDGGEIWEFGGAIYLEGVQDAVVANNTIHDNEADTGTHPVIGNYGGAVFLVSSSGDFLFANNIVHASSGAGVRCGEDVTGQIHRTNALYDNPDGDFLDCPIALGDLYVDPQMVDPAGGDYRLADTSPLIDAGTSGVPGLTLTDIYGAGRGDRRRRRRHGGRGHRRGRARSSPGLGHRAQRGPRSGGHLRESSRLEDLQRPGLHRRARPRRGRLAATTTAVGDP